MADLAVETALERILAHCHPLDVLEVASATAAGSVLAQAVIAPHSLPPFANAGMDGFAIRVTDIAMATPEQPVILPQSGSVQAGGPLVTTVAPGTAVRIMTGAPLPDGAEAVVPLEEVTELADGQIAFMRPAQAGRHIRPAGEDVPAGAVAIPAGTLLRAAEIGLLAALGIPRVMVVRRPVVAIISTGDELLLPEEPLAPGKIRDANAPALAAFVSEQGAQPLPMGIVRDQPGALRDRIDAALQAGADFILTTAGASAGDYDIVSQLMAQEDALEVWRVNLKPGRPLLFGLVQARQPSTTGGTRRVPLLGLPGNPASALIVAELFARPAIARLRGLTDVSRPRVHAKLDVTLKGDKRRRYVRARLEWQHDHYRAITRGIGSGSASLTTLVRANALLIIPEGTAEVPAGSMVEAIWL